MKKHLVLASLVSLSSLFATTANAAFQYSVVRTNNVLTVGGTSYDRVTFRVLNDGTPGVTPSGTSYSTTGTKVLAMENNIEASKPMRWFVSDLSSSDDGIDDVDLTGASGSMTSTQFTKYNPSLYQFPIIGNGIPAPYPVSTSTYSAPSAYASTLTLTKFTGAALNNPPVANVTPFSFLTVLVESGGTVRTFGLVGGDAGGAQGNLLGPEGPVDGPEATVNFALDITSAVPEPTSLSLLAGLALVARRRR